MNRIDRLTAIILLLQGGRRTASEIARRFEVSKRTTFRDIQALCEIGVPIVTESGAHGGYTLMPDYSLAPLQLTQREALLLRLALGSISQLADAPSGAYRASSASSAISLFHNARRSAGICRSVLSVTMVAMSRPLSARHAAALFGSRTQSASRSNQNAGRAPHEGAFQLAGEVADGANSWVCPVQYLLEKAIPALQAEAVRYDVVKDEGAIDCWPQDRLLVLYYF